MTAVIEKTRDTIKSHVRYIGRSRSSNAPDDSFRMKAQHDQQKIVALTPIPVILPGDLPEPTTKGHRD